MGSRFERVCFHGEFREYQSRVLQNADGYLADGKIHIVAAPGSGKTVLGLELIRRIGKPCLIFSPTTAIREQWGERFRALFLEDPTEFDGLFSTNLREIKLVNSLTYQALFTAMEKVTLSEDSYADVDIVQEIRKHHIGAICLDEAHHLKNEWQKALEKLLSLVGEEVKIIALTATPPYDSEGNEWGRYLAMCGEVDEEIFVPELVAKDTLCPHQDYIYFNYPTAEETAALQRYRENARRAIEEAGTLGFWPALVERINGEKDLDELYSSAKGYIALLTLCSRYGFDVDKKVSRALVGKGGLPFFKAQFAETAFQFLLDGELLGENEKETLVDILKRHGLYAKGRVELVLNEKLKRNLISSVGKLESISKIATSEYAALGEDLRMLVLTDYIKKEGIAQIAGKDAFHDISVVSIFETLRRNVSGVKIGVLSGALIILPNDVALTGVKHTRAKIEGTEYTVVETSGALHSAVQAVGELFENGEIHVLVGTKSLLGEGWDAPCINSLIMASLVGSYVLSNQMRGRAIRIDGTRPDKTANIWHLVTVEPEYLFEENKLAQAKKYLTPEKEKLLSYDYEILTRRFDCFMGPNYELGSIESGIERITAIKPPYDRTGIEKINAEMLRRSKERTELRNTWASEVKDGSFAVTVETEVDKEKRVPVFPFVNISLLLLLVLLESTFLRQFVLYFVEIVATPALTFPAFLGMVSATALICYVGYRVGRKLVLHFDPARSIKTLGIAVYKTLAECGLISAAAKVATSAEKNVAYVSLSLRNASLRDQNVFNTAMTELLSPIDNPRYILIKSQKFIRYDYRYSFACPSVIGKKKEYVAVLAKYLGEGTGKFVPVYTRTETGRAFILKCRRGSYITGNHKLMNKKYKVRRWE